MRKLILKIEMTVDGFVGGKNGEIDWMFASTDDEAANWIVETIGNAGLHIMGRRTFNDMKNWWPYSTEVFAAPMNEIPKAAFSRTGFADEGATRAINDAAAENETTQLKKQELIYKGDSWANARLLTGDLSTEIKKLKLEPGKDIVAHGGAGFVQSLIELDLIDEYHLVIHPVVIGQGLSIFAAAPVPFKLELVNVIPFKGGAVAHIYKRAEKQEC